MRGLCRSRMDVLRLLNVKRKRCTRRSMRGRSGDDQVYGLRAFALLVGLDIEADLLSLVQALESSLFDGGDMDEHIASTIVRLDEAVAPFAVKKFHDTGLRHRETPLPALLRRRPHARRLGRHSHTGKASAAHGLSHSAGPQKNDGGGTSLPIPELHTNCVPVERGLAVSGPAHPRRQANRA